MQERVGLDYCAKPNKATE